MTQSQKLEALIQKAIENGWISMEYGLHVPDKDGYRYLDESWSIQGGRKSRSHLKFRRVS